MVCTDLPKQATSIVSGELHFLAEDIVKELYPTTVLNNCFVTNDIPRKILIETEKHLVATALENIIATVVKPAMNSQIQLTAKVFGDVILIQVKDHNTLNRQKLEQGLKNLQPLADRLGGVIGISHPTNKSTSIAFSFPNLALIAN